MTFLPSRRNTRRVSLAAGGRFGALALAAACASSLAQDSGGARLLGVVPTLGLSLDYIDNHGSAPDDVGGEFVTRVSPGLVVSNRSGRVVGTLNYSLDVYTYSKHSEDRVIWNNLDASIAAEAIENWAFIDVRASIDQQNLSPYGQQSTAGSVFINDNRVEVANLAISPYVRGQLGGQAEYRVGVRAEARNTKDSIEGDSLTTGAFFSLGSARGGTVLGWGLQGSTQRLEYRAGQATENSNLFATLTANPTYDLQLSARAGGEANNFSSVDSLRYAAWGVGVRWTPSPRTLVDVSADHRYFGRGYNIVLQHRRPRSVWRFTSSRDDTQSFSSGQPWSLYQLYDAQFASIAPDPEARDELVREFIRSTGQDPNAVISSGFVYSEVRVDQRADLSLALLGRRTTANLRAFYLDSIPVQAAQVQSSYGKVRQYGGEASVSHRLTQRASVTLGGSWQETLSTETDPGNNLQSINFALTGKLNQYTSGSVGARYETFDSVRSPYRNSTLFAALTMRF